MSKELVISSNRHETRVAVIEDDQLVEIFHEREQEYSLAGSIHKGRVTRVLPGMQSAFVDIGLERDAFLYVSDFFEDNDEYDKVVTGVEERVLKLDRGGQPVPPPNIEPPSPTEPVEASGEMAALPAEGVTSEPPPPSAPPQMAQPARSRDPRDGRGGDRGPDGRDNRSGGDRGPDRGGDGRDRGRRSRRRRGGDRPSGGRGLPDSKFYTPRPEADRVPEPVAAPVEAEPVATVGEGEDFFVLPGESLAKYTHAESEAGIEESITEQILNQVESAEAGEPEGARAPDPLAFVEPEPEAAAEPEPIALAARTHVAIAEPEPAEVVEAGPAAAPEPEPVAAAAPQPVATAHPVVAAEPLAAAQPVATPQPVAATAPQPVATAHPVAAAAEPQPAGAPEAETGAEAMASEFEPVTDGEAIDAVEGDEPLVEDDSLDAGVEAAPAEGDDGPMSDEEGPEPARIPTSLTATLREQNSRYPHRMSRRMRRKGGPRGPEGQPAQREHRPQEGPRPEQRQEQTPQQRVVTRPEPAVRVERTDKPPAPSISDLLREGQEIIVQIAKEPLGAKGARITSHIALPGRFLVYMPTVDHVGVSRKIPSDEERIRLKRILQNNRVGLTGGFIVRTAGEGHTEEELRADMQFLYNMWLDMRAKAERRPAPLLIHHDLNVVERILRDQLTASFKNIWVDNEELYESVLRFVQRFQPTMVTRVKLYTRAIPIFDEFGITSELEKALRPKVWLKSGGYIVINQTEALVAIDINTGKYVGKSNRLEDTIVKTNTDAIKEIVRQIRLRDLGGIIVVDFIDMDERKNRQKVMQALEEAMRADRAPNKILQFNDFGLVAITRKRVKQSLERTLCTPCPYCDGAGYVKSPQTVVGEIISEAHKIAKAVEGKDVMLRVSPEVAKLIKSNQNSYLQELEEILGRTVIVKTDQQLHQEKFDLA